jgi:hypothetical protein
MTISKIILSLPLSTLTSENRVHLYCDNKIAFMSRDWTIFKPVFKRVEAFDYRLFYCPMVSEKRQRRSIFALLWDSYKRSTRTKKEGVNTAVGCSTESGFQLKALSVDFRHLATGMAPQSKTKSKSGLKPELISGINSLTLNSKDSPRAN